MSGTSAIAVKAAVVTAAKTLYEGDDTIQVMYGIYSPTGGRDGIGVGNISTAVERPTMNRSREEQHQVEIRSSVLVPGPDSQQAATERAYELADGIAEYFRAYPNSMPAVSIRSDAWISNYELDEMADDRDSKKSGRYAVVIATLNVTARI